MFDLPVDVTDSRLSPPSDDYSFAGSLLILGCIAEAKKQILPKDAVRRLKLRVSLPVLKESLALPPPPEDLPDTVTVSRLTYSCLGTQPKSKSSSSPLKYSAGNGHLPPGIPRL